MSEHKLDCSKILNQGMEPVACDCGYERDLEKQEAATTAVDATVVVVPSTQVAYSINLQPGKVEAAPQVCPMCQRGQDCGYRPYLTDAQIAELETSRNPVIQAALDEIAYLRSESVKIGKDSQSVSRLAFTIVKETLRSIESQDCEKNQTWEAGVKYMQQVAREALERLEADVVRPRSAAEHLMSNYERILLRRAEEAEAALTKAEKELERERMRLAACGTVAMSNTPESAARARDMHPDYRSASCDDVARIVDSEMSLRAQLLAAQTLNDSMTGTLASQAEKQIQRLQSELQEARLTIASITKMLGWANEVPREVLERTISADRNLRNNMNEALSRIITVSDELRDWVLAVQNEVGAPKAIKEKAGWVLANLDLNLSVMPVLHPSVIAARARVKK